MTEQPTAGSEPAALDSLRALFQPVWNEYLEHIWPAGGWCDEGSPLAPCTDHGRPGSHSVGLHPKQLAALLVPHRECFYGGQAGGGKSEWLLAAALQYVTVKGYAALILRRSYADLNLPEAIMSRAKNYLAPFVNSGEVAWKEVDKTFHFKKYGSTLSFSYLKHENDKERYRSAEFQFIGFDELTQFTETQYLYLHSRLRGKRGQRCPLRVRSASNPGGIGHDWVKKRFIDDPEDRIFIPATLDDNPSINKEEYLKSLGVLDNVTKRQLMYGEWVRVQPGDLFRRESFPVWSDLPGGARLMFGRGWDWASSDEKKSDYLVGVKLAKLIVPGGLTYFPIVDVQRVKVKDIEVMNFVHGVTEQDGPLCRVRVEQEPGSGGKMLVLQAKQRLADVTSLVQGVRPTGPKITRWQYVAGYADRGQVPMLRGEWNEAFIDEAVMLGNDDVHDDQMDATYNILQSFTGREGVQWEIL